MSAGTGKRFAYYDQEKREGISWGEPAQRQTLLRVDGRLRRMYEDGTTATGILSPIAEQQGVEICAVAAAVEVIEEPKANEGPEEVIKTANSGEAA